MVQYRTVQQSITALSDCTAPYSPDCTPYLLDCTVPTPMRENSGHERGMAARCRRGGPEVVCTEYGNTIPRSDHLGFAA
jgi:hypothetical protein